MGRQDGYATGTPAAGDFVLFVDASDQTQNPAGTTKRADVSAFVGPKGDQGDPGPQGDPGTPGNDGLNGTNGTNGVNGTDGVAVRSVITETSVARTLAEADSANHIIFTSDSPITVTAPSMAAGRYFYLRQKGLGALTIAAGTGVTLEVDPGALARARAQGAMLTVLYESATQVFVTGDLAAA